MKKNNDVVKGIIMISQIGITMLVPIFLCVFVGVSLDRHFQTSFWFLLFLIMGFMAAFRNVYVLTKQFYAKDKAREDAELRYLEELKKKGNRDEKSPSTEIGSEESSKNNIVKGRLL